MAYLQDIHIIAYNFEAKRDHDFRPFPIIHDNRLETEAEKVGLYCNAKKTEVQTFNQEKPVTIKAKNGETLKEVKNFKYLGAWTESTAADVAVRKALAWSACHRLRKVWSSKLRRKIKERLFLATVESVLLYGSET